MEIYSSVNDAYECIIDYLRNYLYFHLPLIYLIKHLNEYRCLKFFPHSFMYEIYSCIQISVAFLSFPGNPRELHILPMMFTDN